MVAPESPVNPGMERVSLPSGQERSFQSISSLDPRTCPHTTWLDVGIKGCLPRDSESLALSGCEALY